MLSPTLLPLILLLALSHLTSASPAWNKRQYINSTTTSLAGTNPVLLPRGTGTEAIIQARATTIGKPAFEKRQFTNTTTTAVAGTGAVLMPRGTGTEAVLVARGTGTGVPYPYV
ncbi:MAG: hypothetical protein HETSPECPRED_000763 [Heterodermia speciosa]|uniref:Uncharacterized protein n=1 Tax=Heterodermia speciosa TaxID=116794 RepID=A0A8H3IRY1_9LECA|nr:MAG: hypothetical protein HETSPECPRED_000763 [Heterodermia speciosa]